MRPGRPAPAGAARAKAQFRPSGTGYRDVLTPKARAVVEEVFAAEFEYHRYTW
ncbi:hypothetical protein [Streptomyces sp. NPDC005538]|uniref:hypothetical protein n=1 Tax=Streptomyces sp. NPDC005538 TaxID=3157043 RepID=UPI0033A52141